MDRVEGFLTPVSATPAHAAPSWLQRHPQAVWLALLAPAVVFLLVIFAYPIASMFKRSIFSPDFTLVHYERLLAESAYLQILWMTVRISAVVALVALVLGYPTAYFLARLRGRAAHVLLVLVLLPFWTSVLVRSYAWIVILRLEGLVNRALQAMGLADAPLPLVYNEVGVVVGMVHVLLPYMVLALYAVMREIDPSYLRAAANLGAGFRSAFLRVYLPLSMPGVTSGLLLVFILSIGFFVTPALLGGGNVEMIALQIDTQINEMVDWGFGSALATTLFVVVATLVFLFLRLFDVGVLGIAPGKVVHQVENTPDRSPHRVPVSNALAQRSRLRRAEGMEVAPGRGFARPRPPYGRVALGVWSAAVIAFLVAPILVVVAMSVGTTPYLAFPPEGFTLAWYGHYLSDEAWLASTGLSFRVAALTTVGATALGTLAAIGLVRGTFPQKQILFFLLLAPLIVPVIVSAVAVYLLFVPLGLVGSLWGFVLAHMVLAIPVVVLVVSAALRRLDPSLERAATVLGAGRVRAFIEVALPIIRPAVIAGLLFAFITSFDEIVIALFLAGTTSATLPKKMWESLQFQIDPTIAAVSTLLVALSLVVLIGGTALRRKAGA